MMQAFGSHSSPTTEAGKIVRLMLSGSGPKVGIIRRMHSFKAIEDVMYQAFLITARRQFARNPVGDVVGRLAEWLQINGLNSDKGTDLVGLAAHINGFGGQGRDVAISSRRVLKCLLDSAIHSGDSEIPETEFDALVATAEARVARLRRARRKSGPSGPRPISDELLTGPARPGHGSPMLPRSAAAFCLRAIARFESDDLGWAPDEDIYLLVQELFSHAIEARFNGSGNGTSVSPLAAKIQTLNPSLSAPAEELEALILGEVNDEYRQSQLGAEAKLQMKMAAVIAIIEDIGLYDTEFDAWLAMAEEGVESKGHRLISASARQP